MRISLKWLQELVDVPADLSPHEIGEHLTMAGLEVEGITSVADTMKDVLIGRLVEISDVPKKPQAKICSVEIGAKSLSIVTTSKDLNVGDMVVVALPGAKLFDGVVVEARRIFDLESQGVLCCERELGISDDHARVMVLSKDEAKGLTPGQNAIKALQIDDIIFEIAITPNRPDALNHMGVARELAAALNGRSKFQNPNCREMSGPIHDVLLVNIDAREACPRYAARVVENIQIAKSPLWLRARLYACGIRPINNVVDVTNYVLLERGHPLHAFDFAMIAKDRGRVSLHIRFATQDEKLTTLDGVERTLSPDDLVIADTRGPVALAGIMGGENSGVTETTSTILLESAYFSPDVVRRTARRHQLSTEASYRFERGADPNGAMYALDRAADLMVQYAGGKVRREAVDVYPKKVERLEVLVRPKRLQEISGLPIEELDESKIRSRFALLGIETVGKRGDSLHFRVPTFRPDLTREIDLIEEAMRLIGFGKIPCSSVFSRRSHRQSESDQVSHVVDAIGDSLKSSGFSSAMNYSFGSPKHYGLFEKDGESALIRVQNPMGEELSAMRRWLLPGLLENVALNMRKEAAGVQLYEFGTVFLGKSPEGDRPKIDMLSHKADFDAWAVESMHVAGVLAGKSDPYGLVEKARDFDFFDMKGAVESFCACMHLQTSLLHRDVVFEKALDKWHFLHPGFSARVVIKGQEVGFVGRVHPDIQEAFDLKVPVYCFEMDVRKVAELVSPTITMKPMPRYPSISRDMALLLPSEVSALDLAGEVNKVNADISMIEKFGVFDVYTGKGIPAGKKSVALSFVFRSLERTLKDEEVQSMIDDLILRFSSVFGAQVR